MSSVFSWTTWLESSRFTQSLIAWRITRTLLSRAAKWGSHRTGATGSFAMLLRNASLKGSGPLWNLKNKKKGMFQFLAIKGFSSLLLFLADMNSYVTMKTFKHVLQPDCGCLGKFIPFLKNKIYIEICFIYCINITFSFFSLFKW